MQRLRAVDLAVEAPGVEARRLPLAGVQVRPGKSVVIEGEVNRRELASDRGGQRTARGITLRKGEVHQLEHAAFSLNAKCVRDILHARGSGFASHARVRQPHEIAPATGKLAVLLPGLGAVATTMIAGVFLARKGLAQPVGSLTQLGTIRLGKRTDHHSPRIRDFLPLASLDDLEFGAWDIFPEDAYQSAVHADVLSRAHLDAVREELEAIRPMKGVFYPEYVRK